MFLAASIPVIAITLIVAFALHLSVVVVRESRPRRQAADGGGKREGDGDSADTRAGNRQA
jgi:hypothetical protein